MFHKNINLYFYANIDEIFGFHTDEQKCIVKFIGGKLHKNFISDRYNTSKMFVSL